MDLKSMVTMEVKKNERVYRFSMEMGSPYGECFDVAHEIMAKILELANQAAKQQKDLVTKYESAGGSD